MDATFHEETVVTATARPHGSGPAQHVVRDGDVYTTPLLPGFELHLDRLLERADRW